MYRPAIYLHSDGASRRTVIVVSITIAPLPIDLWVELAEDTLQRVHVGTAWEA